MNNKIKHWYEISYLNKNKKVIEKIVYRTMNDERKKKELNKHLKKAKQNKDVAKIMLVSYTKDNFGRKFLEVIKSITLRNSFTYTDNYVIEFFKGRGR